MLLLVKSQFQSLELNTWIGFKYKLFISLPIENDLTWAVYTIIILFSYMYFSVFLSLLLLVVITFYHHHKNISLLAHIRNLQLCWITWPKKQLTSPTWIDWS